MRCDKAEKMVLEYSSGELTGKAKEKLEQHLDNCTACREYLHELAELEAAVSKMPTPREDKEFFRRLPDQLWREMNWNKAEKPTPVPFWHRLQLQPSVAAAFVVVFLVVGIWSMFFRDFRSNSPVAEVRPGKAVVKVAVNSPEWGVLFAANPWIHPTSLIKIVEEAEAPGIAESLDEYFPLQVADKSGRAAPAAYGADGMNYVYQAIENMNENDITSLISHISYSNGY